MNMEKTETAFIAREFGSCEVLKRVRYSTPDAIPEHSVAVRHSYIAINRFDFLELAGKIGPSISLPFSPGGEAVGVVEKVGLNVSNISPGDRVGYCFATSGSACSIRVVPDKLLYRIPDFITDRVAIATSSNGLMSMMMSSYAYSVVRGSCFLVWGAAGRIGGILTQILKGMGCRVVGVTRRFTSIASVPLCDMVISENDPNFVAKIREKFPNGFSGIMHVSSNPLTKNALELLGYCGTIISTGVEDIFPQDIDYLKSMREKSLYLCIANPNHHYNNLPGRILDTTRILFGAINSDMIKLRISHELEFDNLPKAYELMNEGSTNGSIVVKMP